jgi:hypothetical protein
MMISPTVIAEWHSRLWETLCFRRGRAEEAEPAALGDFLHVAENLGHVLRYANHSLFGPADEVEAARGGEVVASLPDETTHGGQPGADRWVQGDEIEAPTGHGSKPVPLMYVRVLYVIEFQVPARKVDGPLVDIHECDPTIRREQAGYYAHDAVATSEIEDTVCGAYVQVLDQEARATVDALAREDAGFGYEPDVEAAQVGFYELATTAGSWSLAKIMVDRHWVWVL